MKESIQGTGNEVAIVIYDAPLPPKYFRLKKSFIRTLLITAPLLTLFLLAGFFFWGLGLRLSQTPAPKLPVVISESDSKLLEAQERIKDLEHSNKTLSDKLVALPASNGADDPYLMVIKKPYGMQNLLAKNKIIIDQMELLATENKVNLKFQLVSSNPESKVSGHILVFMLSNSGMTVYPQATNTHLTQGIKYSEGETFAFSRLRPTNAEFSQKLTGDTVKFVIYIFNREGDLLVVKETESFKVEIKK